MRGGISSVLAGMALLVTVACSPSDRGASPQPSDIAPTASPTPTTSPSAAVSRAPSGVEVAKSLEASTATDGPAQGLSAIQRISMRQSATTTYVVLGVSADARLLASQNDMSSAPPEAILGTPHLGWLSRDGFEEFSYDDVESSGRQITSAHVEGDKVTWVETTSTDLFNFDWRIYSATLGTTGRDLIAASDDFSNGRPLRPVFGSTEPVLVGESIYWAATKLRGDSDDAQIWAASVAPAAAAPAKPAIEGGYLPTSDGGSSLYYVKPSADGTTSIMKKQGRGEKPRQVVALEKFDGGVTRLAASGSLLAWVESYADGTSQLLVKDLVDGEVTAIRMEHSGSPTMFLDVSQGHVAWGNGSAEGDAGQYLYDASSGAPTRLSDSPGLSLVYLNGNAVAWPRLKASSDGPPSVSWVIGELP